MLFFGHRSEGTWRCWLIECMGAFFIALATVGFASNPLGIGLIGMLMVYIAGVQSTGFFNPACTVTLCLNAMLRWRTGLWYISAQLSGALLASIALIFSFGEPFCPTISPEIRMSTAVGIEALLSCVLCMTALLVAKRARTEDGCFVFGFGLVGLVSFGGIFNPAIACASLVTSMLYGGGGCHLMDLAVYCIAPFIGALGAARFQRITALK